MPEYKRPSRLKMPDFAGRLVTLSDNPENWRQIAGAKKNCLILGVGTGKIDNLPFVQDALKNRAKIFWLEDQIVLTQLNQLNQDLPLKSDGQWQYVDRSKALELAPDCNIFLYNQAMRLAPDFWGPLLADLEIKLIGPKNLLQKNNAVWLPGNNNLLLHQEIKAALFNSGFTNIYENSPATLKELQQGWCNIPAFTLSINFRGMDSEGRIFNLCDKLNLPVAIWLVDNPWHLLSGIQFPWWKKASLFVTDPSFIAELKNQGAENVYFCPLAASSHMWQDCGTGQAPPVFVGRSEFPDKNRFFKGCHIPEDIQKEAVKLLDINCSQSELPDYNWWQARNPVPLWPGMAARMNGLGADECSSHNRCRWLKAALPYGLHIIGDSGWQNLLPGAEISPPVDYYGLLPDIYKNSTCVLNITSLLLPQSLNQRHFDVWAAGGLLLSDDTSGLKIFPEELVEPMRLKNPENFGQRLAYFQKHPDERAELIRLWQNHIRENHTYERRIEEICATMKKINKPS